jgi:long-chain acyl-CoA synthetase
MGIKAPWLEFYGDVPHSLTYPLCSMTELVEQSASRYPEDISYSFMGRNESYAGFMEGVYRCARAFAAIGVKAEDRIMLCLPNVPQALECFYAVNLLGAVAVMVHPLSSEGELKFYIENSKPSAVVTLDQFYDKFDNISSAVRLPVLIVTGVKNALGGIMKLGYILKEGRKIRRPPETETVIGWGRFLEGGDSYRGEYRTPGGGDHPAAILYSGGTTGTTKGIVLTNLNFNALALQTAAMGHCIVRGGSMLAVMPIFHGFGLGVCIHTVLVHVCRCILVPRFSVKSYAGLLKKLKPNYIAGVPTLFEALLRGDSLKGADLSCLKGVFSGGDSLSIELKRKFDKFLEEHGSKVRIREGYGTTECVTASCLTPYNIEKEGSIGLPFPDTFYKIVKPGGTEEVPYGKTGEICIHGPTVMKGYLDMPEETEMVLKIHSDGRVWLHTGDLGTMDEQGFVYFKQRIKRLIVSSGYSIYPSQLENVIDAHESVKMSCVIGVPHPYRMQVPKAFIVLREGVEDTPQVRESIMAHCRENIAKYALPREIEIRESLPKTLVGKVAYRQLEEEERRKASGEN